MCDLTMLDIGKNGRFGNQLFQLMALLSISNKFGFIPVLPDHYNIENIFPQFSKLIKININEIQNKYTNGIIASPDVIPYNKQNTAIVCIQGYFQFQEILNLWDINDIEYFFNFGPQYHKIIEKIREEVKDTIVCHIRRGDYVTKYSDKYAIIKEEAYLKNLPHGDFKVLFVGEDYKLPTYDLPENVSFLADFFRCMMAPVFLRSNSTFGWWAATLAKYNYNESQTQYSPLVLDKTGIRDDIEFVNGNWPLMAHPKNFENCRNTDLYLPLT